MAGMNDALRGECNALRRRPRRPDIVLRQLPSAVATEGVG